MATPIVDVSSANDLINSVSSYLIANLPFILAIVGFSIVANIVLNKLAMKSSYYGGSLFDTVENFRYVHSREYKNRK